MIEETTSKHESPTGAETAGESHSEGRGSWGARQRAEYLAEQLRNAKQEIINGVLRAVPPDVLGHLNNSRKEMLLAVRSLIDKEIDSIDRCTERSRNLHEAKPEGKEAKCEGAVKTGSEK